MNSGTTPSRILLAVGSVVAGVVAAYFISPYVEERHRRRMAAEHETPSKLWKNKL